MVQTIHMICDNCGKEFDPAHDKDLFLDLYYGIRPLTYEEACGSLHLCIDCAVKTACRMDEWYVEEHLGGK